jgi:hypothetical protein
MYAQIKNNDWGLANYRLRGSHCSLVLNHLHSELAGMYLEAQQLYSDPELSDTKDMSGELKGKIGQLMEETAAKFLTYCMDIPPLSISPSAASSLFSNVPA